jgi:hypothetical protein
MRGFHFSNLKIAEIYGITTEDVAFNDIKVAGIQFHTEQNTTAGLEKNIADVLVEDCFITHTTKIGIWSRHGSGAAGIGNDSINRNMNLVFRNNHFYETGGSGIILSRSYNCLLENNIFEYPGSGVDPRMANRGSGAWFWKCMNVIAQYNKSLHVRGHADSYGMHIDYGNRNVVLQYNYSEDSEGGFVEILGDNLNSVYRFNVSVNDGLRDKKGNSIWLSGYVGTGVPIVPSDSNYIYNNTIYVSGNQTPDIDITGKNTYIYNNIFYAADQAVIGETVYTETSMPGGRLRISNNLFYGDVRNQFTSLDLSPVFGDPRFVDPGQLNSAGYRLNTGSEALTAGMSFREPVFPEAGKGIFSHIPPLPDKDYFGHPVSISTTSPNIGAYNGEPLEVSTSDIRGNDPSQLRAFFDRSSNAIQILYKGLEPGIIDIHMFDVSGRQVLSAQHPVLQGMNKFSYPVELNIEEGLYFLTMNNDGPLDVRRILILR